MPRIAIIKKDRCNPEGCGGYLCARVCPINMQGKDCIVTETADKKPKINEELCTGCGICPNRCPFKAIEIINLPEQLENPIHQYGENGFHLYNLPTPIFGKVVGIVGRNGIGKSTAIKIIAGMLKPNLGTDKEASWKELAEHFKGKEAQNYFEAIRDGKIKVAFKPQQVELIAQMKGKVEDLLRKADEKKEFDKIVEELQLKEILDRDINQVSGGELQRIAIAATVLRKANLYIFDEPTSYLDIKQRIRISKFIKKLATEDTAVIVVEHDLIILDYMTDLIHIMYGKEASYGIVSLPKTTRTGMNIYLEGYLKDENMRFRDHQIKFESRPPLKTISKITLTSWQDLHKKLGNFTLETQQGKIGRNQIIGILGENGIGKTTFMKILAGEIKSDKGEVNTHVKISYKPQYLESGSDELVLSYLKEAMEKYQNQIIKPLEIDTLLLKPLNTLSGGELQRVAIAKCLGQQADLYLLDEPSAYLDIEQRLIFSKIIRDIAEQRAVSVLVVDHDIMFIDYLSDQLMIFEGKPAIHGTVTGPYIMEEGMNKFLTGLNITMRRDIESRRPRINKTDSRLDREQKETGKLYYG